jgi:hypothetical protein
VSARRQLRTLVTNALRLDFRPRGSGRGSGRWARIQPLVASLAFNSLAGLAVALMARASGLPIAGAATLCFAVGGAIVFMHLLVEASDLLVSPLDGDILYWRPISGRTLFLARALHVLAYVFFLSVLQLVAPALVLSRGEPHAPWVAIAILVAGWLHAVWVTALVFLLHGAVLRRLRTERLQEVLGVLQIAFGVAFVAGYQLLAPELLRAAGDWSTSGGRALWLPPAWFAAFPALVREGWHASLAARAGIAVAALAVAIALAAGALAPRYESTVQALHTAGTDRPARASRRRFWPDALADRLGGDPLRRAGFEFLLAQMRGDRRTRVSLWMLMAMPLGVLLAAVLGSGGTDPYAVEPAVRGIPELLSRWGADEGRRALFFGSYLLAFTTLTVGRGLGRSTDWRAAWVFHATPLRRYDEFCCGLGIAVMAATFVPALVIQAGLLLTAWRDPLHVAIHLAPPFGLSLVALAAAPFLGFEPPFTREPVRSEGAADIAVLLVSMLPITLIAIGHWALRMHPWLLLAGGAVLASLAPPVWWLARRRVRNCFRDQAFAA